MNGAEYNSNIVTLRDAVWDEVLITLVEEGKFKISDLQFDTNQRHTVRRVLREMEGTGWLMRESDRAKIWRAGEKARKYLSLTKRAEVMANED